MVGLALPWLRFCSRQFLTVVRNTLHMRVSELALELGDQAVPAARAVPAASRQVVAEGQRRAAGVARHREAVEPLAEELLAALAVRVADLADPEAQEDRAVPEGISFPAPGILP